MKSININGKEVVDFTPELTGTLAIVSLSVLTRLAGLLPKADLYTIKRNFTDELRQVSTMEEYITLLEDELSFHKSVNMISLYKPDTAVLEAESIISN